MRIRHAYHHRFPRRHPAVRSPSRFLVQQRGPYRPKKNRRSLEYWWIQYLPSYTFYRGTQGASFEAYPGAQGWGCGGGLPPAKGVTLELHRSHDAYEDSEGGSDALFQGSLFSDKATRMVSLNPRYHGPCVMESHQVGDPDPRLAGKRLQGMVSAEMLVSPWWDYPIVR